ncbi:MAG: hypothetical protein AAB316_23075, partial [Bacteroidota bacterium]
LRATGQSSHLDTSSYVKIDCETGLNFNVQASVAVPMSIARHRTFEDPPAHEQALEVPVKITGKSLQSFSAALKSDIAPGDKFNFIVPGAEGLVFHFGSTFEAWFDYDAQQDPANFPQELKPGGVSGAFRGFWFKQAQCEVEGFVETNMKPLAIPVSNLTLTSDKKVNVKLALAAPVSGTMNAFPYTLEKISAEIKNGQLTAEGIKVEGNIGLPIAKNEPAKRLTIKGNLGFIKTSTKYEPVGQFLISPAKDKVFDFIGMNGLRFVCKEGSMAGIKYSGIEESDATKILYTAADTAFRKIGGKFMAWASLTGDAGIFMDEKVMKDLGVSNFPAFNFGFPALSFQGLTINDWIIQDGDVTASGSPSGAGGGTSGAPASGNPPGGGQGGDGGVSEKYESADKTKSIRSFRSGIWGSKVPTNEESSALKPPGWASQLGLQGFPLSLDAIDFEFTGDNDLAMRLEVTLNMMASQADASAVSTGSANSTNKVSDLSGTTALTFKFANEKDGFKYKEVQLNSVEVEGAFGPVEISGGLAIMRKTDAGKEEYGNGFKAYLDVTIKNTFNGKAMAQFGTTQYNYNLTTAESKKMPKGEYRYFFLDLEITREKGTHLAYGVFLHGVGGGFYYNMACPTQPSTAQTLPSYDMKPVPVSESQQAADPKLLDPGYSLSGITYRPRDQGYGGYLRGIFSMANKPEGVCWDVGILIEVAKNDANKLTFSKVKVLGNMYTQAESIAKRREDHSGKGTLDITYDHVNKVLSGD